VSADERDELIFLYASGALEGDERDEVEAWLASGDRQAFERLAAAEAELAQLGHALPPVEASAAVKQRLLQRIENAALAEPVPSQHRRHWLRHPALAAGLAALAAALVGGAVAQRVAERAGSAHVDQLRGELASLEHELAALRSELDQTAAERTQLDRELADEEAARRSLESDLVMARKAIGVLASEKAEAMALVGTAGRPARARVVWDWENWYCFLHVTGLAPDPNLLYALWLFTDTGEVVGLGPFGADASGQATLVAPVPHDLGHVVRAGVSLEPDPDLTSRPRGEVVLLGERARHSS